MLRNYRQRNPGQPLAQLLWWDALCLPLSWAVVSGLYGHRWWGHENVPRSGPTLLLCNHQSYLDLIVLGVGLRRHFHPMARRTLFDRPSFSWLIRSLNAFPVDQGRADIKAMRRAIELMGQGHLVLVFPEGSRTEDGRLGAFNPGVMLLIRRAKPTVVPMAIDGVFDIWPIGRPRPKLRGRTGAIYGRPIAADTLLSMPHEQATALLQQRIESLRLEVRGNLRHISRGRYPLAGAGDVPTVPL
jgi:1-acyl-sn-glycerol-3-phosphate acyltransferase